MTATTDRTVQPSCDSYAGNRESVFPGTFGCLSENGSARFVTGAHEINPAQFSAIGPGRDILVNHTFAQHCI
jgi:hypothetical protein